MSDTQFRKWRPSPLPIPGKNEDPLGGTVAPHRQHQRVVSGQVSNFSTKPSEYKDRPNWQNWSFNLQCYDQDGQKTDIVPVFMSYVSRGQLVDGNQAEVYGSFGGNGVFRADKILNLSTRATIKPAMGRGLGEIVDGAKILYVIVFLVIFVSASVFIYNQFIAIKSHFPPTIIEPTGALAPNPLAAPAADAGQQGSPAAVAQPDPNGAAEQLEANEIENCFQQSKSAPNPSMAANQCETQVINQFDKASHNNLGTP